eukprot:TRINITY_DN9178_c0_g1_i15.p1 TRINITY_DN9178_c0_g1~~TRINITY_DN9178_c0_g1_i15.p1  ORF type:complete len:136 (+),score=70.28 TRINITY_DN9178_c0_g1_i15:53-460(+)
MISCFFFFFFFQAEDGIRDAQESRGLGDVYKRQGINAEYGEIRNQKMPGRERAQVNRLTYELKDAGIKKKRGPRKKKEFVVLKVVGAKKEGNKNFFKLRWKGFCLLYTSDAADEEDSVDLGGRRIIKKKKKKINL